MAAPICREVSLAKFGLTLRPVPIGATIILPAHKRPLSSLSLVTGPSPLESISSYFQNFLSLPCIPIPISRSYSNASLTIDLPTNCSALDEF